MRNLSRVLALGLLATTAVQAIGPQPIDLNGSNFTYPYPIKVYKFTSQRKPMEMAFMDVPPAPINTSSLTGDNTTTEKVAVLFHGKNFCGATWNETIQQLSGAGYRVVVPDQVGWCKSTKPVGYQFSFQQLALNTNSLLRELGIYNATIIGHSTGGMLAARYGLTYPTNMTALVMVNPLGLEDWQDKGVPYESIDDGWVTENATTWESIMAYEENTYYVNTWKAEYDEWVTMLYNIYYGSERQQFIYNQAQTTDMIFTQPVIYEFPLLTPRTLLMIGDKDNTAIGKKWSPASVQAVIGNYSVLGPEAAALIPNSTLIQFPDLGHAPQIEDPESFHQELLGWLSSL
ncbi:alpha/beta hydrolase fold domain-containing protein [Cryphonectria parasitica EP155]|uniref:Alpha/beta hydrolase fold domain-containing protein n=1 Tax=Cryphonectria parasitica (strain ATCC 38755 / EP155) TaxID=660469 RepID=A0A9P5CWF8_CRYP1|nr:alpha/beta hydrolase fold domain-containing protein [Cryphonectria parasitica EP155]KAF3771095.1 alpha/beta hydrolase fold domain-containing protein [Cryphonectria parasitica EP155]